MVGDTLKFINYRKPKMKTGDYQFSVSQKYGDPGVATLSTTPTKTVRLKVRGDRIRLNSDQVFAQYPPAGESGNFNDTLPHLSLKKATLPWERSAYDYDNDDIYEGKSKIENCEPWLYLMLINDNDIDSGDATLPKSVAVKDLKTDAYVPQAYFDALTADITSKFIGADEQVQVVDIKKSFFDVLIAEHKGDLQYLAHVRQRHDAKNELTRELSVIIGNRFAQSNAEKYPLGMVNHALLVSLEGYLNDDGKVTDDNKSMYATGSDETGKLLAGLDGDSYIRFVILTSWSFTSKAATINFEQRSKALDVGSLRLPSKNSSPEHAYLKTIPKRDAVDDKGEPWPFNNQLQAGMTAVLHQFRLGDQSLSWYRGPCVSYAITNDLENQLNDYERGKESAGESVNYVATDADRLLGYYEKDGMFDISYAAAYELGRFLAMRNEEYVKTLYRYKRAKSRYIELKTDDDQRREAGIEKGITIKNLPYAKLKQQDLQTDLTLIKQFLQDLALLKGIPHWYLLPDPDLLPQRTLRTFQIDPKWIRSLWLGALSLSGRAKASYDLYNEIYNDNEMQSRIPQAGFFLRSDLVWAYPEVLVDTKLISSLNQLCISEWEFTITLSSDQKNALDNCKLIVLHDLEDASNPTVAIADNLMTIHLGKVGNETTAGQLKAALEATAAIESATVFPDLDMLINQSKIPDFFKKADDKTGELCIAGRKFKLTLADSSSVTAHKPSVTYDLTDGSEVTVSITDEQKLNIKLGNIDSPTTVDQLTSKLLEETNVSSVAAVDKISISSNQRMGLDLSKARRNQSGDYADCIEGKSVRQEELAKDLLLVLTDKTFNYLSLALPPEALHYGADIKQTNELNSNRLTSQNNQTVAQQELRSFEYTKNINYGGLTVCEQVDISSLVDDRGIVKIAGLASKIKLALETTTKISDVDYKKTLTETVFASAHLGRFMLEGEPKVEFSLGGNT